MLEVNVGDWRYELSFHHGEATASVLGEIARSGRFNVTIPNNGTFGGRYRYTTASIQCIDDHVKNLWWEGMSICSPLDQFCKAEGRRLSMDRAIATMIDQGGGPMFKLVGKALRKAYYQKSADFSRPIDVALRPN